ncbi:endodeoxyribonuclease ruS [Bacteriophage sp.]|nr:endodeoxyribonuclease ruS [Bacteriophage sp.]
MIFLSLPFPPSVNSYRTIYRGMMRLSKEGRAFKAAVADYVVEYRVPKLGDAKLKVTMVLFPRDKRKIDIDNRIKAVLDALEDAGVFNNDFQVDHLEIIRGKPVKGGGIRVMIEAIEPTPSSSDESPSEDS